MAQIRMCSIRETTLHGPPPPSTATGEAGPLEVFPSPNRVRSFPCYWISPVLQNLHRGRGIFAGRGDASLQVFSRGTNEVNRYTLFELLAAVYQEGGGEFPFPDFTKLEIRRSSADITMSRRACAC